MKPRTSLLTGVAVLVCTIGVYAQTSTDAAPEQLGPVPAAESQVTKWSIDPLTWEVVGPESDAEELKPFNTPDQTDARYRAVLVLLDPDEYYRQFPKTFDQLHFAVPLGVCGWQRE